MVIYFRLTLFFLILSYTIYNIKKNMKTEMKYLNIFKMTVTESLILKKKIGLK